MHDLYLLFSLEMQMELGMCHCEHATMRYNILNAELLE